MSQQVDNYKEKTESLCEESLELMNKFENIKDLLDDSKNSHVGVEPEVDRTPDSPGKLVNVVWLEQLLDKDVYKIIINVCTIIVFNLSNGKKSFHKKK